MKMNTTPSLYKPSRPSDFIGQARMMAQLLDSIVQRTMDNGDPIKIFLQGEPGIGKSALLDYFTAALGSSKWNVTKINGGALKSEQVQDFARSVQMTDLFSGYRILRIEEVDKANHLAQVQMLTLLDDLPRNSAVLCTSNKAVKDLDARFQWGRDE